MLYKTSYKPIIVHVLRIVLLYTRSYKPNFSNAILSNGPDSWPWHALLLISHAVIHECEHLFSSCNTQLACSCSLSIEVHVLTLHQWCDEVALKFAADPRNLLQRGCQLHGYFLKWEILFSTDGRSTPCVDKLLLSLHFVPFLFKKFMTSQRSTGQVVQEKL